MNDELPAGWGTARISELCDIPKEKGREGVVPYLEIGNVDIVSKNYTLTHKPSVKGCRVAKKNDVLVSKVRPTRGAIVSIREDQIEISSAFTVLRSKGALADRCLWQFLAWNRAYLNYLGENCTGTMYPTTSDEVITDFEMPLAPLAEQRRIVAKLEKLLGQVDACQQRLEILPTLLKRFRQSILAAACSGRLTADWREENPTEAAAKLIESVKPSRPVKFQDSSVRSDLDLADIPESWVWTNLRYLISPAEAFCYGVVQPGENNADGVFLVRAGDLVAGRVDTSTLRRIPRSIHDDYRRSQLLGGEILVTVVGAGIGETAIAQPECAGFNIARAVAKLPIREFEARYVHLWLLTSCAQNWMKGDSREVARPTLNLEQLQTLPVPIPPLAEQQEIVRRVADLFALADQLEQRLAQARKQVDKLTPALLARAFAGKLVPQDPGDEPAEKLLERIKSNPESKSHRDARK